MHRHLLLCVVASTVVFQSGCVFSKKSSKPKENPAIASDVEEGFMKRWVDRRRAELVAQGEPEHVALTQAVEEFRKRYGYTNAAKR